MPPFRKSSSLPPSSWSLPSPPRMKSWPGAAVDQIVAVIAEQAVIAAEAVNLVVGR